jgi:hypothetical protein
VSGILSGQSNEPNGASFYPQPGATSTSQAQDASVWDADEVGFGIWLGRHCFFYWFLNAISI